VRTVDEVRRSAVGWAFDRPPADLAAVLTDLEFVQADPIRAPARAQDLILGQRVAGYRAGDLEHRYPVLDLDEDYLYAYGFVTPRLRPLLHPRRYEAEPKGRFVARGEAAAVLAFVRERGVTHPRDVQAEFGKARVVNGWGGTSIGTTVLLERLHHHGLLRVARREAGIRLYEAAAPLGRPLPPERRIRQLLLRVARTLAPVPVASLGATVARLVRSLDGGTGRAAVRRAVAAGELATATVDEEQYVWPADLAPAQDQAADRVRLLAPFDPVVWDRRRFERLWGWAYRFEAYTPAPKRQLGYYAMPLLWRDRVTGWANCGRDGSVEVGFVDRRPRERAFTTALDEEIARLRSFLGPGAERV
jgi:uncharacterized protein YcaQ